MPTWLVRLRINVPGLGERLVDIPNVPAPTLEQAVSQARAAVIVEPVQAQQTAATP